MGTIIPHYKEGRSVLAEAVPLSAPYTVQCEVSQLCNLKCNYCIQPVIKEKKELMTFRTFEAMCNQMTEFDVPIKQLNFAGWGEPLVNPRLPRMIRHAKNCNAANNIAVVTNGLLLTPSLSKKLIESGLNHLRISIQGMTAARYYEVTGRKVVFEHLVDKIKFFFQNRRDWGNCELSIKIADTNMTPEEEKLFLDTFLPISDRAYVEFIQPVFDKATDIDNSVSKFGVPHKDIAICPQPFYMLAVTAAGDIRPCCSYFSPIELGNVNNSSLLEAWESSRMEMVTKTMLQGRRKYMPVCGQCNIPNVVITPEDNLDSKIPKGKE